MPAGTAEPASTLTPEWRAWLAGQFDRLDRWFAGRLAFDIGAQDQIVTATALLAGDHLKSVSKCCDRGFDRSGGYDTPSLAGGHRRRPRRRRVRIIMRVTEPDPANCDLPQPLHRPGLRRGASSPRQRVA